MSAAFRVAFNDSFDAGGDSNNLKPLVDRGKAEALVDNVFTFQGSIENHYCPVNKNDTKLMT